MWVLGLNSSGLVAGTFSHEAILLAQNVDFLDVRTSTWSL